METVSLLGLLAKIKLTVSGNSSHIACFFLFVNMIEVKLPAIDGNVDAVVSEVLQRSVRLFCKEGLSSFETVRALIQTGILPEDIERINKGQSNQSVEVLFKFRDCLRKLSDFDGVLEVGGKTVEVSNLSLKRVMLKIHWLPIYFNTGKLSEIFSKFGKVLRVTDEHFQFDGVEIATGVRRVLIEMEEEKLAYVPHLLSFACGARALVTMYGRPPLCLRCHTVGHIRRECPDKDTGARNPFSAEKVQKPVDQAELPAACPAVTDTQQALNDLPAAPKGAQPEEDIQEQTQAVVQTKVAQGTVQSEGRGRGRSITRNLAQPGTQGKKPVAQQHAQPVGQGKMGSAKQAGAKGERPPVAPKSVQPVTPPSTQLGAQGEDPNMETDRPDIRGERRARSRSGERDFSQLPRNKVRRAPATPSSPEHTGLTGMLSGDSFMDSLLDTMSPHSESL